MNIFLSVGLKTLMAVSVWGGGDEEVRRDTIRLSGLRDSCCFPYCPESPQRPSEPTWWD